MVDEAEKKTIAELNFDVRNAVNRLDEIQSKLDDLARNSDTLSKTITSNLNNIKVGDVINTNDFQQKMQKISGYTTEFGKKAKYTLSSVDFSKMIDVNKVSKQLKDGVDLTKSNLRAIQTYAIKNNVDTMNNIKEDNQKTSNELKKIKADEESYKDKLNEKRIFKEERDLATIERKQRESEIRKEEAAYKSALKQEQFNNMQVKSTQTMYDKIMSMGQTYLLYQGFNQLKQGIRETIDEMTDLEYQMVAIDRVLNDSTLNIDLYRDKLLGIASDYGNEMSNVTDIALRLAQAGYDQNEVLELTKKTMLALNTADLNAKQATDDMVAIMAQWGYMTGTAAEQAEKYGNVIDMVNKVADNFPTTSADVMDALKKVSSAFNLAGASIEETIATIVAAEKASQRGGKAIGTALSNITQQLKDDKRLDIAESLGLNFFKDANKTEFKDIMDIFQEMSDKMQQLKNAGKENSVEMQNLLSIFTVFRRNIGASLLGEMSDSVDGLSTYAEVLNTVSTAAGYSLSENEKYLKTTKAAQAQFNDELLKLKTEVWDNGVKGVYKDLLTAGSDLVGKVSETIEKFGVLPTAIGVAVAAYTTLNKNSQLFAYNSEKNNIELNGFFKALRDGTEEIRNNNKVTALMAATTKESAIAFGKNTLAVGAYAGKMAIVTAKTIALQVATLALNAAISFGLSAAITAIVSGINKWVHSQEIAIEQNNKLKEQSQENATKYKDEAKTLTELGDSYEEAATKYKTLKESKQDTSEVEKDLLELQTKINKELEGTGKQVNIIKETTDKYGKKVFEVNEAYEKQLQTIKGISYEKKKQQAEELKSSMEAARDILKETIEGTTGNFFLEAKTLQDFEKIVNDLEKEGKESTKEYKIAKEELQKVKKAQEELTSATEAYMDVLGSLYLDTGAISKYSDTLSSISKAYSNLEGPNKLINSLQELNQSFVKGEISSKQYFDGIQEKIKSIDFSALQTINKQSQDMQKESAIISEDIVNKTESAIDSLKNMSIGLANTTQESNENMIKNTQVATELTEEQIQELQAYEAIFAETTELVAENLSNLMASYEDGKTNWVEYSEALKETGESSLQLYTQLNNLQLDEQTNKWTGASDAVNEYANSLQGAINELQEMSPLLDVIGKNYEYIAENSNIAGEALFNVSQVGTKAYQDLATNVANSLIQMRDKNSETAIELINAAFGVAKDSTKAYEVSNEEITKKLQTQQGALNTVLNNETKKAAAAAGNVSAGVGQILEKLGDAIEHFDYNITGTLEGFTTKEIDILGNKLTVPNGLKFKISGDSQGSSLSGLSEALKSFGSGLANRGAYEFAYTPIKTSGSTYTPPERTYTGGTGGTGSTGKTGSSGGGSSGRTSSGSGSEYYAKKEEEQTYKDRLSIFTDYVSNKEKLESNWVKRQKELGQLSNKDYLYIIQERIKRYQEYLNQVNKMTWLNEEDKLKLQTEYQEKIKDLEVDYLKYLEGNLDEEIEKLKDSNKEKIKLIEDEADARINSLKKLKQETSRIRDESDYDKKRQEILKQISYWEQRTGKEAQNSLKEAKENLSELDEEWRQQLEDWSIDDQIEAIEAERDAQVKAIEDSQEAEIAALQAVYDARVKLYAETGQIIYDQSQIQSASLYNSYKENFVNPIMSDLDNIQEKIKETTVESSVNTTAETAQPQYETYTIKKGDTLSGIAKRYSTTVAKLMEANPYITNANKIYAGKTLQIPKFHTGGIYDNADEGLAILKRGEMILKPEWTVSMQRLMKYVDNVAKGTTTNISNGNSIEVTGNLVNIDIGSVRSQSDINAIGKQVEKILKDKFNIKK